MIHQYKNNGYNIVLDVNSGSIHVVDDVVYDVLSLMDEENADRYGEAEFSRIADVILKNDYKEEVTVYYNFVNDALKNVINSNFNCMLKPVIFFQFI